MRTLAQVTLAALVLSGAGNARANGWQDTPDALQLQPIGDTLRMNGTPMAVRSFTSEMAMEDVLRQVQANWQRPGNGPVLRSALPTWTVLNQTVGNQHRSLQVRQKGNLIEGFVALTSPKETREPKLALRMPAQMTALQVVESLDNGKRSQQVVAVSHRSMDYTVSALEDALKAEGWTRHMLKKKGEQVALSANRGDEQFDALISNAEAGAMIMMNTIK
jgi:hypothetical protein